MKKIFDERGFLTKEGEQTSEIKNFKHALKECLEATSAQDIQLLGSILHKIVGDAVFDAAQAKRHIANKLSAMTDEEFEKYLEDKYSVYGKEWIIKASLTEEEFERQSIVFKKRIEKWMEEEKKRPREQHHGLKLSPRYRGRGRYID